MIFVLHNFLYTNTGPGTLRFTWLCLADIRKTCFFFVFHNFLCTYLGHGTLRVTWLCLTDIRKTCFFHFTYFSVLIWLITEKERITYHKSPVPVFNLILRKFCVLSKKIEIFLWKFLLWRLVTHSDDLKWNLRSYRGTWK